MTRWLAVVTETDDFVNAYLFRHALAGHCAARGIALDQIAVEAGDALRHELGELPMPGVPGDAQVLPRPDPRRLVAAVDEAAARAGGYDAVWFFCFSGYLLRYLARRTTPGRVVVYDAHVLRGVEELARVGGGPAALVRLLVEQGVEVVCPYHPSYRRQYTELGLPEERVRFCLQPVHGELFTPAKGEGEGEDVVAPGETFRDWATLAAAELPGPVVVAAGDRPPDLPAERFRVLPRLTYRQYRDLIARARVVVLPLAEANCGLVTLSMALNLGRPVVVTETDYTTPYVEHERTGLFVAPGDAGALRAAVERLLGDSGLRGRLGAAGRERARGGMTHGGVISTIDGGG